MITSHLIDIIILLLAAVIIVPVSQRAKFGTIPGFLIAGIIVGPFGIGLIDNIDEIRHLSEIGIVLLLFIIGIEIKPSRLWRMRRLVFGLGSLQVIITGLIFAWLSYTLFEMPVRTAILIGPALALSSTAFVLQLLTEQKSLVSEYGRTSISILLLQDLAVVPLLALVPLLVSSELSIGEDIGIALLETVVILGSVILVGRYLLHPTLHRIALSRNPEVFTASAIVIVLGTALITEHIGLSMAMGAFLAGLLISDSSYKHQVLAEIKPFSGLLLGLFFISMGMSLDFHLFLAEPLVSLGILFALIAVKIAVLFPLSYLFGVNAKKSFAVSLLLAQSGEFALVLFALAFQAELLSSFAFQHLLLLILLSMLATPLLAYFAQIIKGKPPASVAKTPKAPIIIAGFGRVGHRIGQILTSANQPFIAFDLDANIVERERSTGQHPVFYGDVSNVDVLKAAGVNAADTIVVTLNDPETTRNLVRLIKKRYPDVKIYAGAHNSEECIQLGKIGVAGTVSENLEASIELAKLVLKSRGVFDNNQNDKLNKYRKKYHQEIKKAGEST